MLGSRWLSIPLVAVFLLSAAPPAGAASYYRLDEVTVNPILFTAAAGGGIHPYSGPDLQPGVDLESLQYDLTTTAFTSSADYSQPGFSPAETHDGIIEAAAPPYDGWAVDPFHGDPHQILWAFVAGATPVDAIRLVNAFNDNEVLHHFQLYYTTDSSPTLASTFQELSGLQMILNTSGDGATITGSEVQVTSTTSITTGEYRIGFDSVNATAIQLRTFANSGTDNGNFVLSEIGMRSWMPGGDYGENLKNAHLQLAALGSANLQAVKLSGADLSGADLSDATIAGADMKDATLVGANLSNLDWSGVNLTGADLTGAILTGSGGKPTGAPSALPVGYQMVSGFIVGPGIDLTGADLSGADLSGLNLSGADLTGADVSGADLLGVNLSSAVLTGVSSGSMVGSPSALPSD